jgi:hypothetical protein
MHNQLVTFSLKGLAMLGHFGMFFINESMKLLCLISTSIFRKAEQIFIIFEVVKQHPPSLRLPTV